MIIECGISNPEAGDESKKLEDNPEGVTK